MDNIISAAELRRQIQEHRLAVEKRPGIYRWWFPQKESDRLISRFSSKSVAAKMRLQTKIIQGVVFSGLYFGISSDMSRRIRWHILGPFKSSTLRRTLWAVVAPDADENTAETIINKLIDSCFWEWEYTETVEQAECRETEELAQQKIAYPLNISKNKTMPSEWIAELKLFRANVKRKRK